ncbi:LPXTG cell wall anchor domain-containing protein, partial [Candidatus Woesearchaeota archaeon]|nr:LPXTG cell wall anchor domain-containing protein [Candidatus Woesearchaeota archaeon]
SESPIIYVGNIDEDDYESASFYLKVEKDTEVLPLVVRYKDALNNDYEETYNLALNLHSANGDSGPNYFMWFIIIVVLTGGVWWWLKRKKSKKH